MSAQIPYIDGSAARRISKSDSRFQVIPGGGAERRTSELTPLELAVRIFLAVIAVVAVIGAMRITLNSATVASAIETKQLQSQITEARSVGNGLEVEHSTLSNPTRIKSEASQIGLKPSANTAYMDLSGDIAVKDDEGNLMLAASMAAIPEYEATMAAAQAASEAKSPKKAQGAQKGA